MERTLFTLQWGRVEAVRKGQGSAIGTAPQWRVDVLGAAGNRVESCLVMGDRVPLVHSDGRPSWGMVGFFGGNLYDAWFLPCPWLSAATDTVDAHERLDEYSGVAITIGDDGTYAIRGRPDDAPRLEITPDGAEDDSPSFEILGGSVGMARIGDSVTLTAHTSPAFFGWMAAVNAACGALGQPGPSTAFAAMLDPIPGEEPPATQQIVGQIATASPWVKGK